MKRFLMLVGVAVVAAAMYVAASPASKQATGPSEKRFVALEKKVTTLNKNLKALKKDEAQVKSAAAAAVDYIGTCFLTTGNNPTIAALAVSQRGSTTDGYLYGTTGAGTPTTALDVVSGTPQYYLQEVSPTCLTAGGLTHAAASRLQRWIGR
jgi:putative Ca2+/H+ antiporter (TMEM165/GDT1 family)